MRVPAPLHLDAHALDLREQIAALPPVSGIYALHAGENPPHISSSANLPRRLLRLLVSSYTAAPPSSLVAQLRQKVDQIECWPTTSKLESALITYHLTKRYFPADYLLRLRLRMPWFTGISETDPFARLIITNRILRKSGPLFGPFASRDLAQQYQEEALALFQVRRCTDVLLPAPDHPGCIYGEMNQCLRPCQCAVTEEEYATEVARLADFLSNNGKGAIAVLSAARARAAEATDFEQAAQIHKRVEKMTAARAARHEVISNIHSFNGVALTRALEPRQFRLWPMLAGHWLEPLTLDFTAQDAHARSLDQELRERLHTALAEPHVESKRLEDLAIFSRWYYSSWRDGQWFPFRTLADLNYRRLVREISNLVKTGSPSLKK